MAPVPITSARTDFGAVKAAIHRKLIQKLNLDRLNEVNRDEVRREVGLILEALVVGESTPMNLQERERLAQEVLDEVFGLGPLEPLLADPTISDILVNTYRRVYIERKGVLEQTAVQFRNDAHLMGIIDQLFLRSAGAWTSLPQWWMPGSRTVLASTPSFLPSR